MENTNEKLANLQLHVSENCPKEHQQIIESYWQRKGLEFVNKPGEVNTKYNIYQSQLSNIISSYSILSFYLFCKNCNSYEKQSVKSQTRFKQLLPSKNRYSSSHECDYCRQEKQRASEIERQKQHNELILNLENAIENKNWENLSNFERGVLTRCLEMNFNQLKIHYGKILGQSQFIKLIRALRSIEDQNLLVIEKSPWNGYIANYQYIPKLLEYKEEINFVEERKETKPTSEKTNNTIKLKLTVNENQNHPDSPMFSGIVQFKEKIVIEPDVDYIFGHWQRANNNLYLTLTPLDDVEKLPEQKRISNLPISLQKGITDFINNMGKNIDF